MSSDDEVDPIEELLLIKKYVDEKKAGGDGMFVSGWDDDNDGIEDDVNPNRCNEAKMMWAAENGKLDVVRQLVEEDPSLLSARDRDGYSPLHRASYNNHVDIVEYLIYAGSDISAKTLDCWQPLHSACHWNNTLCAIRLLENGADINASTAGGQTPLHLAAAHGASKDTLEMLLMNPLIEYAKKNNAGETAYDIAKRSGPFHILFQLTEPCLTSIPDNR